MKGKLIGLVLSCALTIGSIMGCGNTANTNTNTDSSGETSSAEETQKDGENASEDVVEIRMSWWGDTTRNEKYNEICDRFEAENPDVKVIREFGSWNDYWDKLATQVAGGNAPDVISMHVQYVSDYAGRDVLADLQPYIDSGILDVSKMESGIVDGCKYNGTMCLVPMGITFTNMLVNQTLLEKYGIDVPTNTTDYTWNDLMAMGEKLKAAADAAGETAYITGDSSTVYTMFRYMARQSGGDLYTEDGKLGFEESTLVEWFSYWNEMREKGLIPDAASSTEDAAAPIEQRMFTMGNVGFICTPANQLYQFQEQMPDSVITLEENMLKVHIFQ